MPCKFFSSLLCTVPNSVMHMWDFYSIKFLLIERLYSLLHQELTIHLLYSICWIFEATTARSMYYPLLHKVQSLWGFCCCQAAIVLTQFAYTAHTHFTVWKQCSHSSQNNKYCIVYVMLSKLTASALAPFIVLDVFYKDCVVHLSGLVMGVWDYVVYHVLCIGCDVRCGDTCLPTYLSYMLKDTESMHTVRWCLGL